MDALAGHVARGPADAGAAGHGQGAEPEKKQDELAWGKGIEAVQWYRMGIWERKRVENKVSIIKAVLETLKRVKEISLPSGSFLTQSVD